MYEPRFRKYGLFPHIGILPGWGWLHQHEHDLDDWKPTIQMDLAGVKYNITANTGKVINQVVKANR